MWVEKWEHKPATPALSRRGVWVKPVSCRGPEQEEQEVLRAKAVLWQLSFGLHLPKNETQTLCVAPKGARNLPSQRSQPSRIG